MGNVEFAGFTCAVNFARYADNNRVAIQLVDAEDGGPVAMATLNLPDVPMAEDEVAIKDYSENTGMAQALINAGIVASPRRVESSGFVSVPVCALLVNPAQLGA